MHFIFLYVKSNQSSCMVSIWQFHLSRPSLLKSATQCYGGPIKELYSNCKECPGWYQCPFRYLLHEWNVYELLEKQENAYLILCQRFKFPNDVVKAIEGNEDKDIRLGDALHHIYHKNPNMTQEEVFEIISNCRAQ